MDRKNVWVIIFVLVIFLAYMKRGAIVTEIKKLSDSALKLIAGFEGFSSVPYPDAQGQSVGFGHFILPDDKFTYPISETVGYSLLRSDAEKARAAVDSAVRVPLTRNQADSLISLTYNIGLMAFRNSTLTQKLNAGDYAGAAEQFSVWRKSMGKVNDTLVARRAKEKEIFLT